MELGQLVDHFKKSDPMAPYSSAIERELVSAQDKINSGYPEHSKDANEGIGRLTKYFVSMMVQSGFAQASKDNGLGDLGIALIGGRPHEAIAMSLALHVIGKSDATIYIVEKDESGPEKTFNLDPLQPFIGKTSEELNAELRDKKEASGTFDTTIITVLNQDAATDNNLWNNLRNNYHSVIVFAGNPNVHADLPDDVNPWRQIFIKARGLFSEKGPILIAATAAHYDEYQELQRILSDYPKSRFKGENKYSLEQHMARVLSGHPYAIHARYIGYSNLPKAA